MMRALRVLLVALIGIAALLGAGTASAQLMDDPSPCPEQSQCGGCIRQGGVWDADGAAAGRCGGVFCCDLMTCEELIRLSGDEPGECAGPADDVLVARLGRECCDERPGIEFGMCLLNGLPFDRAAWQQERCGGMGCCHGPGDVEDRVALWDDDSDLVALPCWASIRDSSGGTLYRLYRAAFGREPDAFGFRYWIVVHLVGQGLALDTVEGIPRAPLEAIADHVVRSGEFQDRYGDLDDEAFLDELYAVALDRTADARGRAHWLGELAGGTTRAQVLLAVAESAELRALTAGGVPPDYPLDQLHGVCDTRWSR